MTVLINIGIRGHLSKTDGFKFPGTPSIIGLYEVCRVTVCIGTPRCLFVSDVISISFDAVNVKIFILVTPVESIQIRFDGWNVSGT